MAQDVRVMLAVLLLATAHAGCLAIEADRHCPVTGRHLQWVQPGLADAMRAWPADDERVWKRPPNLIGLPVDPALMPGGANATLTWVTQHVEHGSVTLEGHHPEGPVLFLHWHRGSERDVVRADLERFVDLVSHAPAANKTAVVDELMAGWDAGRATTAFAPLPLDVDGIVANLTWSFAYPGQWASHERPHGGLATVAVWRLQLSPTTAVEIDAAGGTTGPSDGRNETVQPEADLPRLQHLTRKTFAEAGLPDPELAGARIVEETSVCR